MSRHLYQTDCIVLGSRSFGEESGIFSLLTREFGLIEAVARGIRKLQSKLRPGLRDYSRGCVTLVETRHGWRVGSFVFSENFYDTLKQSGVKLVIVAHVFRLLQRLLHGEEKDEKLFSIFVEGLCFCVSEVMDDVELRSFECAFVLSILHRLGYVGDAGDIGGLIVGMPMWDKTLLSKVAPLRQKVLRHINRSLKASQL